MDHDDSGPIADLSPADSDAGKSISPRLVLGAIVTIVAALVLLGLLR